MNRQKDDPSEDSNFRALTTTVMFNDFEKLESMIKSAQFSRYIKLIRFSINLDGKENRSKNHSFLPSDNLSLMHVAAFYDALECFIILSQNGFQVDCQSADSLHPIQYACYSDAVEIVSYILQVKPSEATFNFSDKVFIYLFIILFIYARLLD
ncbi:hypothetical protein TRFO_08753 [Tritrichomonas foetus]|uniref:Uncharacterized protein n=1 Tax=Tritrichomonas foetus TaxID=1144522 RepID=A0A1J4JMH0_9EUKA|nr:hypothetical protein TRFO_08753 [Tritrichomonas foetus]|eukprot:OHS98741.1 hypothetical protein TRFO_08753 [Tritrichomonas foetus]